MTSRNILINKDVKKKLSNDAIKNLDYVNETEKEKTRVSETQIKSKKRPFSLENSESHKENEKFKRNDTSRPLSIVKSIENVNYKKENTLGFTKTRKRAKVSTGQISKSPMEKTCTDQSDKNDESSHWSKETTTKPTEYITQTNIIESNLNKPVLDDDMKDASFDEDFSPPKKKLCTDQSKKNDESSYRSKQTTTKPTEKITQNIIIESNLDKPVSDDKMNESSFEEVHSPPIEMVCADQSEKNDESSHRSEETTTKPTEHIILTNNIESTLDKPVSDDKMSEASFEEVLSPPKKRSCMEKPQKSDESPKILESTKNISKTKNVDSCLDKLPLDAELRNALFEEVFSSPMKKSSSDRSDNNNVSSKSPKEATTMSPKMLSTDQCENNDKSSNSSELVSPLSPKMLEPTKNVSKTKNVDSSLEKPFTNADLKDSSCEEVFPTPDQDKFVSDKDLVVASTSADNIDELLRVNADILKTHFSSDGKKIKNKESVSKKKKVSPIDAKATKNTRIRVAKQKLTCMEKPQKSEKSSNSSKLVPTLLPKMLEPTKNVLKTKNVDSSLDKPFTNADLKDSSCEEVVSTPDQDMFVSDKDLVAATTSADNIDELLKVNADVLKTHFLSDGKKIENIKSLSNQKEVLPIDAETTNNTRTRRAKHQVKKKPIISTRKPLSNRKNKKKKYPCYYCRCSGTTPSRHYQKMHSKEVVMQKLLQNKLFLRQKDVKRPKSQSKRDRLYRFLKNSAESKQKALTELNLLLNSDYVESIIIRCDSCQGLLPEKDMHKHNKRHQKPVSFRKNTEIESDKNQIQPNEPLKKVLSDFTEQEEQIILKDSLLIEYGNLYCICFEEDTNLIQVRLRIILQLYDTFKKYIYGFVNISDIFNPKLYHYIVIAINDVAEFDIENQIYGNPVLAAAAGSFLKDLCDLFVAVCVNEEKEEEEINAVDWCYKYASNFNQVISRIILKSINENTQNVQEENAILEVELFKNLKNLKLNGKIQVNLDQISNEGTDDESTTSEEILDSE